MLFINKEVGHRLLMVISEEEDGREGREGIKEGLFQPPLGLLAGDDPQVDGIETSSSGGSTGGVRAASIIKERREDKRGGRESVHLTHHRHLP